MKKIKAIAMATSILILLSASAVFAATTSNSAVSVPKFSQTQSDGVEGSFKSHLESLLAAGTINQAQEDAIQGS